MDTPKIDLEAAAALLRAKRNPLIQAGAHLDRAFFAWCASVEFGAVEIISLFPKTPNSTKSNAVKYPCEFQCPRCGNWQIRPCSKEHVRYLIAAAKSGELKGHTRLELECESCKEYRRREREEQLKGDPLGAALQELRNRTEEEARQRTPAFIETYLNPRNSWPSEFAEDQRYAHMTREAVDNTAVAGIIRAMSSEEFRKTPYWSAVQSEVFGRAGNRCWLCPQTSNLSVYYRDLKAHGLEHTQEGLQELQCLCRSCRQRHARGMAPNN